MNSATKIQHGFGGYRVVPIENPDNVLCMIFEV